MDQPPKRDPPPARLEQPLGNGPLPTQANIPGLTLVPPAAVSITPAPASAANERDRITKFRTIECWVSDRISPITASSSEIFTAIQIAEWLKEPIPAMVGHPGAKPAAGLRIVCREQKNSMGWPFDKVTLEAMHDALGMPRNYSYFGVAKSGGCGKYLRNHRQQNFVYYRSNNNGTISAVLKYDSTTNITTGYALLGPRISLETLCARICSQFPEFPHPLLVPTVLIELTATDLMRELFHIHRLLTVSEYKTKTGDWQIQDSLANTTPEGKVTLTPSNSSTAAMSASDDSWWLDEDAVEIQRESDYWKSVSVRMDECKDNHQALAQILGFLSCRYAFMSAALQCSLSMIEFTLQEMGHMKDYVAPANRRMLKGMMNDECLRHRLEFLKSHVEHLAAFGAIGPRMQTQQTVLFNIINLSMAQDSKEIAAASQRDSSAMKIIAMLTTLFLPGTFIATFFSMPILDWRALSMDNVMTNHFWVYWAIAIPLTVVVMLVVGAYGVVQERRKRDAARNARNIAGLKEV